MRRVRENLEPAPLILKATKAYRKDVEAGGFPSRNIHIRLRYEVIKAIEEMKGFVSPDCRR